MSQRYLDDASASHRFEAHPQPLGLKTALKFSLSGLLLMGAVLVAMLTLPQYLHAEVLVFMLGSWGLGGAMIAFWWWHGRQKFLVCVTSGGLTINRRPGEVYSFSEAKLGPWNMKLPWRFGGKTMTLGEALDLQGSRRFVLGGRVDRPGIERRYDAPAVGRVDAWMSGQDFDELLAIVGRAG